MESEADITESTIEVTHWPTTMKANADTIRAALFSGEMPKSTLDIEIMREDGRGLHAFREKKGWAVRTGQKGSRYDSFAVRQDSRLIGSRVNLRGIRRFSSLLFDGRGHFSWEEAERIMLQFISSSGNPGVVHWVAVDRT